MNTLVEVLSGSRLYGLAHAGSDRDVRAVYRETPEQLIGLRGQAETIRSERDGVDYEAHPLRKFVSLALACNPNILDTLFAPRVAWLTWRAEWEAIYDLRRAFLSERVRAPFSGMAYNHLTRLQQGKRRPGREALIAEYGWDCKDGAHLCRLLIKLESILTTGDYNPVLEGLALDFVRAVREGAYSLAEVLDWAERRRAEIERTVSVLPPAPDSDAIERAVMRILRSGIQERIWA